MVRTKAGSVSTKAVGAKAPAKVAITAILSGNTPKSRNHGNPYHPRDTPGWQKPITFFMKQEAERSKDDSSDDKSDNEQVGRKRLKVTPGSSKDYLDKDVEESEGIPGIPATSSSGKTSGPFDNTGAGEQKNVEGKRKLKGKQKEKATDKGTRNTQDKNNKEVHHSDMEVENDEEEKVKQISDQQATGPDKMEGQGHACNVDVKKDTEDIIGAKNNYNEDEEVSGDVTRENKLGEKGEGRVEKVAKDNKSIAEKIDDPGTDFDGGIQNIDEEDENTNKKSGRVGDIKITELNSSEDENVAKDKGVDHKATEVESIKKGASQNNDNEKRIVIEDEAVEGENKENDAINN